MNKKWDLRRVLMVGLGGFWLVDGILQLQPAMFTNAFVNTVLAPNVQNQPYMIGDAVTFGTQLFGAHPVWFNLVAALIQILIGALLVLPLPEAAQRAGLWLSVVWAFVIWIFGEGFGLIVTGNATFYTGAPGSALIYLLIALALLFSFYKKLPLVAGIIFLFGAFLNMLPMFWQPAMLSMLSMTPSVAGALGSVGSAWAIPGNLIAVDLLLGIGVFLVLVPNRTVAWVTIIFLLIVWWLGQGFGGLQTFPWGTATDPNSAPLLILCLAPIFFIEKTPVKP